MLGDPIGEFYGQSVGMRILPDEGEGSRMEITDRATGTLCGVQSTSTVTYLCTMRADQTILGEGTGIVMTEDGGSATYQGHGVGRFVRPGVTTWRGSLIYQSEAPSLARLNGIAVLFEYEVDEAGKSTGHLYEWK